ncbi:Hypothetical protein HDN1F_29340 [gamma proteobacterium HdN1]|nr:Hypothetical protein HDN1F_29340 [gamma proteobacterium HdN1]
MMQFGFQWKAKINVGHAAVPFLFSFCFCVAVCDSQASMRAVAFVQGLEERAMYFDCGVESRCLSLMFCYVRHSFYAVCLRAWWRNNRSVFVAFGRMMEKKAVESTVGVLDAGV